MLNSFSHDQILLSVLYARTWTSSQKVALPCFYENSASKIYYTSVISRNLFVLNKCKRSILMLTLKDFSLR